MKLQLLFILAACTIHSAWGMQFNTIQQQKSLIEAIQTNNVPDARIILGQFKAAGAAINFKDESQKTPYDYAQALGDNGEEMRALLQQEGASKTEAPSYWSMLGGALRSGASYIGQGVMNAPSTVGTGLQMAGNVAWQGVGYVGQCLWSVATFKLMADEGDIHNLEKAETIEKISAPEENYRGRRLGTTRTALEKFLGKELIKETIGKDEIRYLPMVGFCFSGGGYRAMLETLGWLKGAEKLEILDTAMYTTGLSGSTWALNPLATSNLSIEDYIHQLLPRIEKSLQEYLREMSSEDVKGILAMLARKYNHGQHIGATDIFGAILTYRLLSHLNLKHRRSFVRGNNPYTFRLSELEQHFRYKAKYPLPLSTAVMGGAAFVNNPVRPTVEFSPFTTGTLDYKALFPTWAFGRVFLDGVNQPLKTSKVGATEIHDYGIELPLGYIMGICGSAFATDAYSAVRELILMSNPYFNLCAEGTPKAEDVTRAKKLLSQVAAYLAPLTNYVIEVPQERMDQIGLYVKNEHIGTAIVPNFLAGKASGDLGKQDYLALVDGGYGFSPDGKNRLNIGIMPLLRRNLNLIIICDSSAELKNAPSLRAAQQLAHYYGLKFPSITEEQYSAIDAKIASMFVDEKDLEAPVVVYMPGIRNPAYNETFDPTTAPFTGTLNFAYKRDEAELLIGLTERNMRDSMALLKQAYALAVKREHLKYAGGYNEAIEKLASKVWSFLAPSETKKQE